MVEKEDLRKKISQELEVLKNNPTKQIVIRYSKKKTEYLRILCFFFVFGNTILRYWCFWNWNKGVHTRTYTTNRPETNE